MKGNHDRVGTEREKKTNARVHKSLISDCKSFKNLILLSFFLNQNTVDTIALSQYDQ
jgi:hypothetical protein